MRIIMAPIMAIIFIGWVLYRAFIVKDIKKYKTEVFGGFFFIAIWIVLFVVFITI